MIALSLAAGSLRSRWAGFAATAITVFLGAVVLTAFASLIDTAADAGVSGADRTALLTVAGAAGGWSLVIVVFGVASTMALSLRQRHREIALLTAVGAVPGQIARMLVFEAAALALVASIAAIGPAVPVGTAVLAALRGADQVSAGTEHTIGPVALVAGPAVTVLAAVAAAAVTALRAGRISAVDALDRAETDGARIGAARRWAGIGLLVVGLSCAATVAALPADTGFLAVSLAGQASIAAAIGAALLSPPILRATAGALARPATAIFGAAGELATSHVRGRTDQTAAVTMPVLICTALATVSLYTLKIQDLAAAADGLAIDPDDEGVQALTLIIVGLIAAFAAIVVVDNVVAAMIGRRTEFTLTRRIGATRGQLVTATMAESVLAVAVGLVLGGAAATVGIVGFAYGRTGSVIVEPGPGAALIVGGAVTALALTATALAATRATAADLGAARG